MRGRVLLQVEKIKGKAKGEEREMMKYIGYIRGVLRVDHPLYEYPSYNNIDIYMGICLYTYLYYTRIREPDKMLKSSPFS